MQTKELNANNAAALGKLRDDCQQHLDLIDSHIEAQVQKIRARAAKERQQMQAQIEAYESLIGQLQRESGSSPVANDVPVRTMPLDEYVE